MLNFETARGWYPQNDPVHGFDHIVRVYHLAERLAVAEGADLEIVRAAVLLHDAQDPVEFHAGEQALKHQKPDKKQRRAVHHHASALFAVQVLQAEGWPEERIQAVVHCIRTHRFRDQSEQPATLEARVLFDADKLDAIGAVGVARAVAFAARHNKPIYVEPSPAFWANGELQPGEEHSAYHEHIFKLSRIKERLFTPSACRMAEERHRFMDDFFARIKLEANGEA